MRSNRLWIGVTCGVALALSVVAAVDAGTQTAGAQAKGEPADRLAQGQKHAMDNSGGQPERLWARVKSDGTCVSYKSPGVNCNKTKDAPDGDYVVTFPRPVLGCAWIATPLRNYDGEENPPSPLARIAVTVRVTDAKKVLESEAPAENLVRVWIFELPPNRKANSFSVEVLCP